MQAFVRFPSTCATSELRSLSAVSHSLTCTHSVTHKTRLHRRISYSPKDLPLGTRTCNDDDGDDIEHSYPRSVSQTPTCCLCRNCNQTVRQQKPLESVIVVIKADYFAASFSRKYVYEPIDRCRPVALVACYSGPGIRCVTWLRLTCCQSWSSLMMRSGGRDHNRCTNPSNGFSDNNNNNDFAPFIRFNHRSI